MLILSIRGSAGCGRAVLSATAARSAAGISVWGLAAAVALVASPGVRWRIIRVPRVPALMRVRGRPRWRRIFLRRIVVLGQGKSWHDQDHQKRGTELRNNFLNHFQTHHNLLHRRISIHLPGPRIHIDAGSSFFAERMPSSCGRRRRRVVVTSGRPRMQHALCSGHREIDIEGAAGYHGKRMAGASIVSSTGGGPGRK